MHSVMYEEIACCVFGQDNDLILVPFRGPLGIRLGKVSGGCKLDVFNTYIGVGKQGISFINRMLEWLQ